MKYWCKRSIICSLFAIIANSNERMQIMAMNGLWWWTWHWCLISYREPWLGPQKASQFLVHGLICPQFWSPTPIIISCIQQNIFSMHCIPRNCFVVVDYSRVVCICCWSGFSLRFLDNFSIQSQFFQSSTFSSQNYRFSQIFSVFLRTFIVFLGVFSQHFSLLAH